MWYEHYMSDTNISLLALFVNNTIEGLWNFPIDKLYSLCGTYFCVFILFVGKDVQDSHYSLAASKKRTWLPDKFIPNLW